MRDAGWVYQEVSRRGGSLIRAGPDTLRVEGDPAHDPAILEAMRAHKAELLRLIDDHAEPIPRPAGPAGDPLTAPAGGRRPARREPRIDLRAAGAPLHQQFTITLNAVYDEIMPVLGDSAWKILCYLIRAIDGWEHTRPSGRSSMSIAEIMRRTGKSRNTVRAGLEELTARGCITYTPEEHTGSQLARASITLTIPRLVADR